MKKSKGIIFVAIYLLFMSFISMPVIMKQSVPYNPKGDSIDFIFSVIFLFLKLLLLFKIIGAIGLLFFQEWARKLLIVLCSLGVLFGLYVLTRIILGVDEFTVMNLVNNIFGATIQLLIMIYLVKVGNLRHVK